jgi:ParB-like chromosome segregation protein Spo0J
MIRRPLRVIFYNMTKEMIPIEKLLVNPQNPRFEPVGNQEEAISMMLSEAEKKIINLAKDIAQYGLNPSKSLMVVKVDKGYYLPLEGNRRVTAIKLLKS